MLHWKPPQAPVDTYDIRVTAPGGEQGWASGGDLLRVVRAEGRLRSGRAGKGQRLMAPPLPAPPLQASAPGSAVDHPLNGLVPHTNYTATVHGLRGPNLTSPASITFTTGTFLRGVRGGGKGGAWETQGLISIFSSSFPV